MKTPTKNNETLFKKDENETLSKKDEREINRHIKKYNQYVTEIIQSVMEFDEWYVRSKKEKLPQKWIHYIKGTSKK